MSRDSYKRSVVKSLTWRVIALLLTIIILYLTTGDAVFSGTVGILINVLKTIVYFIHERIWELVNWGREE